MCYDINNNRWMGNQCCEQDNRLRVPGSLNVNNKYLYTFQQDSQETVNPIMKVSQFVANTLPHQFIPKSSCGEPRLNSMVLDSLRAVTHSTLMSVVEVRGTMDDKFYQFQRSQNVYRGEWKGELPHGVGTMYYKKGSVFYGSFIEGVPFGRGRLIMPNGSHYEGDIKYGKANGQGVFIDGPYSYHGTFRDDLKHGEGEEKEDNSYTFRGVFENGEKVNGILRYNNCYYEGDFEQDQFHGQGKLTNADGSTYKGGFKRGQYHGYGEFNWPDKSQYRGQYVRGVREGDGEFFNANNTSISRGIWLNGVLNGEGQFINHQKKVQRCIWDQGKMIGIKTK